MRRLLDMPIRRKLTSITMLVSGLALMVACLCFIAYDYLSYRHALARRVATLAEIISSQTTAALAFNDAKAAEEVLRSLAAESHIQVAFVYDQEGARFAGYQAAEARVGVAPVRPGNDRIEFLDGTLRVVHPVRLNDARIGTVYLLSDMRDAKARLKLNLAIGAGVLAASLLIAFVLTSRLGRIITGPILGLAGTMRSVSTRKDYSIRAKVGGNDELGELIGGFNGMLSQIEGQNRDLQGARDELERRVQARTADLVRLNEDLRKEMTERLRAEESLKEGEERYRSLVESSPDAIIIEQGKRFVFLNPAAAALFGAASPADLLGQSLMERFHLESRERASQMLRRVQLEMRPLPLDEQRFIRLDGRVLDGEWTAIPFTLKGQRAIQLVIRDITKRKELDRMKSEFISTVSHELRTPLTSIRGSLKLIAGGVTGSLAPKTRTMIDIANSSCERLVHLVNDILDIEKIESGKMIFDLRPLDVASVVEKAVEANRGYAQSFEVSVSVEPGGASGQVLADSDRLIQVLTNLISNATKFSPRGEVVTIRLSERADRIRLSVSDRGPGILEEFRARIFQKFSQADSSDTRSKQGSGLGLSISKAIVEKLGGEISFESVPGSGTTFHVDLPRFREPDPVPETVIPGRPRVLVCEDDPNFAAVLRMTLDAAGMNVDVAPTAGEALKLLGRNAYAGMTLDLALPDRDGISLLHELRAKPETQDLPVIVVSAYLDEGRRMVGGEAVGFVDWLEKPVDDERLKSALHRAIRRNGHLPRVLHVEDDPRQVALVGRLLGGDVQCVPAATLADARSRLASEDFDLVIMDVGLPDGSGIDLLPLLRRPSGGTIPVVVHSAQPVSPNAARLVAATLSDSNTSLDQLAATVKFLLRGPGGRASTSDKSGGKP